MKSGGAPCRVGERLAPVSRGAFHTRSKEGPVRRRVLLCLGLAVLMLGAAAPRAWSDPDTLRVSLSAQGSPTSAFVVMPPGKESVPAVVVIHEWWGLNGQIRGIARRLADLGYAAIIPDLYRGKVASDPESAHELMRGLPEERALGDIAASIAWLRAQPRVGKNRIGVVGFCMGGRYSELTALQSKDIVACVMFYGPPETHPEKLASLTAPLLAHFGGADQGIGQDQVDALTEGLRKAGKTKVEIYVYPGAGHAFMNETGRGYHADAARLAWARTTNFFEKELKAKRK